MINYDTFPNKAVFLLSQLSKGQKQHFSTGTHPIYIAFLLHCMNEQGPHIVVSQQTKLLQDLHQALLFFEPHQEIFTLEEEFIPENLKKHHIILSKQEQAQRMRCLVQAQKSINTDIFLISPQSLTKSTLDPNTLKKHTISLKIGQTLPQNLCKQLEILSYRSCEQVELMGEFSMRGAVLDVFSPSCSKPVRIELIGDEVVQIKSFNPINQRSLHELQSVCLVPVIEAINTYKKNTFYPKSRISSHLSPRSENHLLLKKPTTYLDYFRKSPFLWNLDNSSHLKKNLSIKNRQHIKEIIFEPFSNPLSQIKLSYSVLSKNFFKQDTWSGEIKIARKNNFFVFISIPKTHQKENIQDVLETKELIGKPEKLWSEMKEEQISSVNTVHLIERTLPENLILKEEKIYFLKFDQLPKRQAKYYFTNSHKAPSLNFAELRPQDLIVHKQHGIGRFQELKLVDFGTGENEFLVIEYKNNDKLYVPVYSIHQVQKYIGSHYKESLDKLGDKKWLNTKQRVKDNLKDMTLQLMHLYSIRSHIERNPFSSPGREFEKFESEFPFIETKDQQLAIKNILFDLTKKDQPTDRLICGDVGFGKTEIAMRAAFKVIEDGFQVCIMAPTTILSFQHFHSFKNRFQNWPIHIQLLNRFTSSLNRAQIIKSTRSGTLDILIGTHRILTRDIQFKNLGLLIIDEEHLFGVKSKEQFKHWKSSVDTLALSATPIPRSLSISLSGLRQISVINTPPLNRKSIKTYINLFNSDLIKSAILKELERNGQTIFIHNRISDIHRIEELLKNWVPAARIRVAHGRMKELQKKIVLDFFNHRFDVLLCTTIVESGMDFSLAGTLFINDADEFGLSQLHQLRGRIGRSENQAYCYLLLKSGKKIKDTALKRLQIIQENNQPGAGLLIAQHDLQMRGAGDLMGAEQSGFLQDLGFEMYFELLQENIQTIKEPNKALAPEPDLSFKIPAFLPKKYIPHEKVRLMFYKKLSFASSIEEIEALKNEIRDFGGPLPIEAKNLILLNHCRYLAKKLHLRELSYRSPYLYLNFSNTTPLSVHNALKFVEKGLCQWEGKDTLKFFIKDENLPTILKILKELNDLPMKFQG